MKDLTYSELEQAPAIVQFLYIRAIYKEPVGSQMINEAIENHPEYFADEIEHRRKWASIPQSVHDEYWNEWNKMNKEVFKDMPPSKGILGWIDDPKGYKEWNGAYRKFAPIRDRLERDLHEKYYSPYGLKK